MILTVTLNPVLDTTFFVDELRPVYRTEARRVSYRVGGKGVNVVRAVCRLADGQGANPALPPGSPGPAATLAAGAPPGQALLALAGDVGRLAGDLLKNEMRGLAAAQPLIAWTGGETRLQVTVTDAAHQQRAYFAPPSPWSPADVAAVRALALPAIATAGALCICGSTPGPLADALVPEFLGAAAARGLPTLLDTYGPALPLGLAAKPTIVKVNQREAEGLLGRPLDTLAARLAALAELRGAGAAWAILTLGAEGALLSCPQGTWHAAPPAVRVVNPIGCGDAMSAGLLAARLRGEGPEACFRLGMAAAAANTLTWDSCEFSLADVSRLMSQVHVEAFKPRW